MYISDSKQIDLVEITALVPKLLQRIVNLEELLQQTKEKSNSSINENNSVGPVGSKFVSAIRVACNGLQAGLDFL